MHHEFQVHCEVEVTVGIKESMSTVSGTRRASRRQSQDGSADKVLVVLEASSPVSRSRPAPLTPVPGAQNSPIDVEAIEDEVQAVSPSRVPPPV